MPCELQRLLAYMQARLRSIANARLRRSTASHRVFTLANTPPLHPSASRLPSQRPLFACAGRRPSLHLCAPVRGGRGWTRRRCRRRRLPAALTGAMARHSPQTRARAHTNARARAHARFVRQTGPAGAATLSGPPHLRRGDGGGGQLLWRGCDAGPPMNPPTNIQTHLHRHTHKPRHTDTQTHARTHISTHARTRVNTRTHTATRSLCFAHTRAHARTFMCTPRARTNRCMRARTHKEMHEGADAWTLQVQVQHDLHELTRILFDNLEAPLHTHTCPPPTSPHPTPSTSCLNLYISFRTRLTLGPPPPAPLPSCTILTVFASPATLSTTQLPHWPLPAARAGATADVRAGADG